jgi:hypothetical protein
LGNVGITGGFSRPVDAIVMQNITHARGNHGKNMLVFSWYSLYAGRLRTE